MANSRSFSCPEWHGIFGLSALTSANSAHSRTRIVVPPAPAGSYEVTYNLVRAEGVGSDPFPLQPFTPTQLYSAHSLRHIAVFLLASSLDCPLRARGSVPSGLRQTAAATASQWGVGG